jgi:homeobox protein cut-like
MDIKTTDDTTVVAAVPALVLVSDTQHTLQFWKDFNLDNRRQSWDRTCNEMREMKTGSISGRKRLNDLTKAFRSKSKEDQSATMFELLKAYQEEIDQLSRRSKLSEASYLSIYKSLYDAPDPVQCIEALTASTLSQSSHTLEIERLRSELRQYDDEFRQLKNQDITIRRLEDQIAEYKNQAS